jgi:SAM-dependent methyltransferase
MATDPGRQWAINLTEGGYEHHCKNKSDLRKIKRLGMAWRRIFKATKISPPRHAFEIGCGGGQNLATLAMNDFTVSAVDISDSVLARAKGFIAEVEAVSGTRLNIEIVEGDFFTFQSEARYDLIYHFGVVEHYLEPEHRAQFWQKAMELAAPGGWLVSVVPCGRHIMRRMTRELELLGYRRELEEIDYSCSSHVEEFEKAGAVNISAIPHGYFFFLGGHPAPLVSKVLYPLFFPIGNMVLTWLPLPVSLAEKLAQTLIVVGQKPE